jgi:hypothetical protein
LLIISLVANFDTTALVARICRAVRLTFTADGEVGGGEYGSIVGLFTLNCTVELCEGKGGDFRYDGFSSSKILR